MGKVNKSRKRTNYNRKKAHRGKFGPVDQRKYGGQLLLPRPFPNPANRDTA